MRLTAMFFLVVALVAVLATAGWVVRQQEATLAPDPSTDQNPTDQAFGDVTTLPPLPEDEVLSPSSTSSVTTSSTTLPVGIGDPGERYVVPDHEIEPEAKQLAADVAVALTTYAATVDHTARIEAIAAPGGAAELADAAGPLTYAGSWSTGHVVYPQMGGLTDDRASVMVVTRQTIGSASEPTQTVTRTIDIRLVKDESGWRFDRLASSGGSFDGGDALATAQDILDDPRITMPDSARLDIVSGRVSPVLLQVMSDLAEQTPFEIAVLGTGHPENVFETDRLSHHTVGRAVDIIRIGDNLVIDDRAEGSMTQRIAQWLYDHPDVLQVGAPWDLDDDDMRRSFTNVVHQDHIHLAANA